MYVNIDIYVPGTRHRGKSGTFRKVTFFPGCFDPQRPVTREDSFTLQMSVLSGRHLNRGLKNNAVCNVFVKLEVIGCPTDCAYGTSALVQVSQEEQAQLHR